MRASPRKSHSSAKLQMSDLTLAQALNAAFERGRLRIAQILGGADMFSANELAMLMGTSRETVNRGRKARRILGLKGAKRGFRYPTWQLDDHGKPFDVLPALFVLLDDSSWAVYRFLMQPHPELDGRTALQALQQGCSAQVISAAESVAQATFT